MLDVAHNRQASTALRYTLNEMKPARRTLGVFGALEDKNVAALVDPMAVLVDGWYVGDVPDRRGLDGVAVAERLTKARVGTPISIHSNLESAYRSALADARSGDRIVAWGSFATARAALRVESAMAGRET